MSVTITAEVTAKLHLVRTEALGGDEDDVFTVDRPTSFAKTSIIATKAGSSFSIPLSASTPLDVNVSTLGSVSNWRGDTALTAVKLIDVTNNEAVGSGRNLTVFGKGTTAALLGPVPTNTDKIVIAPGCRRQFYTRETAGWTVGTANILRFDPGTNPVNFSLAIAGD